MVEMARRSMWLIGLLAAGGLALLCAYGLGLFGHHRTKTESSQRAEKPPVPVTVEAVKTKPIQRSVSVVGSLWGHDELEITPKIEGRILRIHHDIGDVVRPGDVLIELDPTDYKLAVDEAQRALELELARLGLKELPEGSIDISRLPQVARAAAMEANAASRRERERRLAGAGRVEDRESAETEYAVARANHAQAILEAEATLAAARHRQASLQTALKRLADTRMVVPQVESALRSGVVLASARDNAGAPSVEYVVCSRSVNEGEIVRPLAANARPLLRLVIDRPLKLRATIPERHHGEVRVGQEAELEVEAYPGERFKAKVARVNRAVDRTSRTFEVEIAVANEDRRLSPGSFARVAVHTRTDPAALTVPEDALVSFAGVTKVFVVENDRAREVHVKPGVSITEEKDGLPYTWVEIEGKLSPAALVVTSGQSQLADGTPIRIKTPLKDGN